MIGASSSLSSRSACSGRSCARWREVGGFLDACGGLHRVVAGLVGLPRSESKRCFLDPFEAERHTQIAAHLGNRQRRRAGPVTRTRRRLRARDVPARRDVWRRRSRRAARRGDSRGGGVVHCVRCAARGGGVFRAHRRALCGLVSAPSGSTWPGAVSTRRRRRGIAAAAGPCMNGISGRISARVAPDFCCCRAHEVVLGVGRDGRRQLIDSEIFGRMNTMRLRLRRVRGCGS